MSAAEKYNEQMIAMAKTAFENHLISKQSEGRWLLQRYHKDGWDDPKRRWDWTMAAEIICVAGNKIYVGGDIHHVVFAYGPDDPIARIRWMGQCDDITYYVAQKASIGMGSIGVDRYDSDVAEKQVRDLVDDRLKELADDDYDARFEDPLYNFFTHDVFDFEWPLPEDERPTDEGEGPYHLRDAILGSYLHLPMDVAALAQKELVEAIPEDKGIDDMELLAVLRPWLEERNKRHREKMTEEDPLIRVIEGVLRDRVYDDSGQLWEALRAGAAGAGFPYHFDDYIEFGKTLDPRVFYAHAALARLCELLDR